MLATTITLACLLGLAALAAAKLSPLLIDSVDRELRARSARPAPRSRRAGRCPGRPPVTLRVLDIAGAPVDGGTPTGLCRRDVSTLKAGQPVQRTARGTWARSSARRTGPAAGRRGRRPGRVRRRRALRRRCGWWSSRSVGALVAGLATWLVVRLSLRPVARMRGSVRALPPGARLALPDSHDELRALAEEFNALLERQEQASDRLRRFTGDAAHELRSPVASIRVQAEVAVTNPDPELAQETLADILTEAERLSSLLDGLLSLARSDAGEVPPASPVELVSEVRAAVARLPAGAPETRVSNAVAQAWASAAHAEVELVLDNLLRNACRYARGADRGVGAGVAVVGAGGGRRRRPGHRAGAPREGVRPVLPGRRRPGPRHPAARARAWRWWRRRSAGAAAASRWASPRTAARGSWSPGDGAGLARP